MLGRFESYSRNQTSQSKSHSGISGGITDPTVAGFLTGTNSSTGRDRSLNGTGSIHYAYGSKYVFALRSCAEGMTKFGSGNKWGFFPGVSARWNISDEAFFKPYRKYVNMLSFRPSWGINGNAWFAEGLIYNKYSSYGYYDGVQGIAPENLRLTQIRWEKSKSWTSVSTCICLMTC